MLVVRRYFWILIVLGILLAFLISQKSPLRVERIARDRLPPLPQHPQIQAYFNHNPANHYTEPYRNIARNGDNLEQLLIDNIQNAQHSVDIAIQELRLPKLARAIAERYQAGVSVRVILEHDYNRPWSDYSPQEVRLLDDRQRARYEEGVRLIDSDASGVMSATEIAQNDALVILRNAQVPVIDDTADGSKGSGLMHHKFVLIDDETLITGSANFTLSGMYGDLNQPESRGNPNHLLRIQNRQLARLFREEFNLMWGDGVGGKPDSRFGLSKPSRPLQDIRLGDARISVKFSPTSPTLPWEQSTNSTIASALDRARNSVDLALFVFSEQAIADRLSTSEKPGVKVRALIDSGFAFRYYSEGLDMLGVALADNQCRYEVDNQPWEPPISTVGVPRLLPGDILHHKFGLVDDRLIITGSHNWSNVANVGNDETLLIIENPIVAAHFRREFDRLYATAELGLPPHIAQKIRQQEAQCAKIIHRSSELPEVVNLNTATLEQLETLPRVGEVLGERIIEARPFDSVEDVTRVKGIGEKTVEQWGDRVKF